MTMVEGALESWIETPPQLIAGAGSDAPIFRPRSLRARGTGVPRASTCPLGMVAIRCPYPLLQGQKQNLVGRDSYCIADVQGVLMNEQRRRIAVDISTRSAPKSLSAQEAGSKRLGVCQKRHPYPPVTRQMASGSQ